MKCYYSADGISWTEITNIVGQPNPTSAIDTIGTCNIIVGDNEGALYTTWKDFDYYHVKVIDESDNIIFRGYIENKIYEHNQMTLSCIGIAKVLEWKPFDGNFIYYNGKVKDNAVAGQAQRLALEYEDSEGADQDFAWTAGSFVAQKRDWGILIEDNTSGTVYREWDSSAIVTTLGTNYSGNNASTLSYVDDASYCSKDTSSTFDMVITPTIDGVVIADTNKLTTIQIEYRFGVKAYKHTDASVATTARATLQILKDADWIDVATIYKKADIVAGHISKQNWTPLCLKENELGEELNQHWECPDDTDTELQKYFDKDNGNYASLKGMRIKLTGSCSGSSWGAIMIDYINVHIGYNSNTISPQMKKIDDNGASWIDNDATTWATSGVDIGDKFKIGENTRQILAQISNRAEIEIATTGETEIEASEIIRPDANVVATWAGIGNGFDDVNEEVEAEETPDGTYVSAIGADGDDGEEFEVTMANPTTEGKTITMVKVWMYIKKAGNGTCSLRYRSGGGWSAPEILTLTTSWQWIQTTWDSIDEAIALFDDCNVELTYGGAGGGDGLLVDAIYLEIFWDVTPTFNKYMARHFRGTHCIDALQAVCKLEGASWFEDYENNMIMVSKPNDFEDSGVDLDSTDFDWDWVYEDQCNQVRRIDVWGCSADGIYAFAEDTSVSGHNSREIVDEGIRTKADAQEIADEMLAIYKTKTPSIKLTIDGTQSALMAGKDVDITFVRPTIAKTAYHIRKIIRGLRGLIGIKTTVFCGLGHTDPQEKLAYEIRRNAYRSQKALLDRLIAPGEGVTGMSNVEVEAIINAELVDGQSIDNAIDALIAATYTNAEIDALFAAYTPFVWRTSEPTAFDFTKATLVDDTNWNDLDLSAIVPAGASAVLLDVGINDAILSYVRFRKNGQTNVYQVSILRNQVANIDNEANLIVGLDSNRIIEIQAGQKPTDWVKLNIVVLGWWL